MDNGTNTDATFDRSSIPKHLVDDNEEILAIVYRHKFGLIVLYSQAIIVTILLMLLVAFLLPKIATENNRQIIYGIAGIIGLIIAILLAIVMIIARHIYIKSQLIITDENITYIDQQGLFRYRVTRINIESIVDVTSQQQGIGASIFGFGNLHIQTAGDKDNIDFNLCPDPNKYAKTISDAQEFKSK